MKNSDGRNFIFDISFFINKWINPSIRNDYIADDRFMFFDKVTFLELHAQYRLALRQLVRHSNHVYACHSIKGIVPFVTITNNA